MLAPMPIAANLGLTPLPARLIVPMALGSGGNTITVSRALWQELRSGMAATADFDAGRSADAFAAVVRERASGGRARALTSRSCIRTRRITTSWPIGWPRPASIPIATSSSSSCRHR